jgi:hypothetical protein
MANPLVWCCQTVTWQPLRDGCVSILGYCVLYCFLWGHESQPSFLPVVESSLPPHERRKLCCGIQHYRVQSMDSTHGPPLPTVFSLMPKCSALELMGLDLLNKIWSRVKCAFSKESAYVKVQFQFTRRSKGRVSSPEFCWQVGCIFPLSVPFISN